MSHALALPDDNDRYEMACDQAIMMCGGSLRGAIKALIMANEFLEMEVEEMKALSSSGYGRGRARVATES